MPVPRDRLQANPYRRSAPFSHKPNRAAVSFGRRSYLGERAASIPGIGHLNLDIPSPGLHLIAAAVSRCASPRGTRVSGVDQQTRPGTRPILTASP